MSPAAISTSRRRQVSRGRGGGGGVGVESMRERKEKAEHIQAVSLDVKGKEGTEEILAERGRWMFAV